eukprot:GCRY01005759.1.p1 GENE.GCRY01005759.1~~GCRY01005759.1.p1  ORF type:complete len:1322 (-),score=433.74 GCRY01005759.1:498-4463(-)
MEDLEPQPSQPTEPFILDGIPVFLDGEGNYYDIQYSRLNDEEIKEGFDSLLELVDDLSTNPKHQSQSSQPTLVNAGSMSAVPLSPSVSFIQPEKDLYSVNPRLDAFLPQHEDLKPEPLAMPNPDNFETYDDFEQALIDWKQRVEKIVGFLRLPIPAGRHFCRPSLNIVEDKEEEEGEIRESEMRTVPGDADLSSAARGRSVTEIYNQTRGRTGSSPQNRSNDATPADSVPGSPPTERHSVSFNLENQDNADAIANEVDTKRTPTPDEIEAGLKNLVVEDEPEEENQTEHLAAAAAAGTQDESSPSPCGETEEKKEEEDNEGEGEEMRKDGEKEEFKEKYLQTDTTIIPVAVSREEPLRKLSESEDLMRRTSSTCSDTAPANPHPTKPVVMEMPWDQGLVPQEPDTLMFACYEDYETAMLQWYRSVMAMVAAGSIDLPPHPSILQDMFGIKPVQHDDHSESELEVLEEPTRKTEMVDSVAGVNFWKSGLIHPKDSSVVPITLPSPPPPVHNYVDLDLYPRLTKETKTNLAQFVDELNAKIQTSQKKFGTNTPPLLPIIHGVFQRPFTRSSSIRPVRRTDLTREEIVSCQDSNAKMNEKLVEFSAPLYDIANVDLKALRSDNAYLQSFRHMVTELRYSDMKSHLHSWYHPNACPETGNRAKAKIFELLRHTPKLSVNDIFSIAAEPLFLDSWADLLSTHLQLDSPTPDASISVAGLLINVVTPATFSSLLSFLTSSNDPSTRHKLCHFICSFLIPSARGQVILDGLVERKALRDLHLLCDAFVTEAESRYDLMPYIAETIRVADIVLPDLALEMRALINDVYLMYYLSLIAKISMQLREKTHPNAAIQQSSTTTAGRAREYAKATASDIGRMLLTIPSLVNPGFFALIRHRSSQLSALGLFLAVQVLSTPDVQIQQAVRMPEVELIKSICDLLCSRLTHARYAGSRLFSLAQKDLLSRTFIAFFSDKDNLHTYLLTVGGRSRHTHVASKIVEWVTGEIQRLVQKTVVETPPTHILKPSSFHIILKHVLDYRREVTLNVVLCSRLLVQYTRAYYKLGLLKTTKSPDLAADDSSCALSIQYNDVKNILASILGTPTTALGNQFRFHMLQTLRLLLKNTDVFTLIKTEADCYQKIITFCRDGRYEPFARCAWKLFAQIVKHHSGVVEHLVKSNQLAAFLEIIDTNAPHSVVVHGLNCLTKLFCMGAAETTRLSLGKGPTRGDDPSGKGIEKDNKAIINYYMKRRLFIKMHMIHQNTCDTMPGFLFSNLVAFYQMLVTAPVCSKLLKELLKNPGYKEGILRMTQMQLPPSERGSSQDLIKLFQKRAK